MRAARHELKENYILYLYVYTSTHIHTSLICHKIYIIHVIGLIFGYRHILASAVYEDPIIYGAIYRYIFTHKVTTMCTFDFCVCAGKPFRELAPPQVIIGIHCRVSWSRYFKARVQKKKK